MRLPPPRQIRCPRDKSRSTTSPTRDSQELGRHREPMTDQIDITNTSSRFLIEISAGRTSVAKTGQASTAQTDDERRKRSVAARGRRRSGVSGPSSEQRVSAEAVKGAGKEKEDFFPARTVSALHLKPFTGRDGKNTLFRWAARPIGPKPMPELCIPLTAGAFSLRYNGKS